MDAKCKPCNYAHVHPMGIFLSPFHISYTRLQSRKQQQQQIPIDGTILLKKNRTFIKDGSNGMNPSLDLTFIKVPKSLVGFFIFS